MLAWLVFAVALPVAHAECVRTAYYPDADGDGYGTSTGMQMKCLLATGYAGYSRNAGDCNDASSAIRPGATEVCNGLDDNCDGSVDPSTSAGAATWYLDGDRDSYGGSSTRTSCTAPSGYVSRGGDCDDTRRNVRPGATEVCNGLDDNCDGSVDPTTSTDAPTWYRDADLDGYAGSSVGSRRACSAPAGYTGSLGDCNDAAAAVSPVATEVCDGVDNNCDGQTDPPSAADAVEWWLDADGDGYGGDGGTTRACALPAGYAATLNDCDDAASTVYPGAEERCDDLDNDCDGEVDGFEMDGGTAFFLDLDGDGYGDPSTRLEVCGTMEGMIRNGDDCDDLDPWVSPEGVEECNGLDDDCDGVVDPTYSVDAMMWFADLDGDGEAGGLSSLLACESPGIEYSLLPTDCDDEDPDYTSTCPPSWSYHVYYGDLHAHSGYSADACEDPSNYCQPRGTLPGEDLYETAASYGLDFVANTDHAEWRTYTRPSVGVTGLNIWSAQQALAVDADGGPVVPIVGYEYSPSFGHRSVIFDQTSVCGQLRKSSTKDGVNKGAYGYERYAATASSGYTDMGQFEDGLIAESGRAECAGVNWITFAHHPAYFTPAVTNWSIETNRLDTDTVVEIASAHGSSECADLAWDGCDFRADSTYYRPAGSIQRALQLGYHLGFVGGSDDHQSIPGVGDGPGRMADWEDTDGDGTLDSPRYQYTEGVLTGILSDSGTVDRSVIFDALLQRHSFASTWRFDDLHVHAWDEAGNVYLPGDDIPAGTGTLHVDAWIGDPEVDSWYAEVVDPTTGDADPAETFSVDGAVVRYIRIRAWVDGVEQRVWASPFFGQ